jgi:hypothetical protein
MPPIRGAGNFKIIVNIGEPVVAGRAAAAESFKTLCQSGRFRREKQYFAIYCVDYRLMLRTQDDYPYDELVWLLLHSLIDRYCCYCI